MENGYIWFIKIEYKMKLFETLVSLLKQDPNYISENGELKKWVVISNAQNHNPELIGLLLEDKDIKAKFFSEIKGVLIFNQSYFIQFLEQKNYLNDSYTAYNIKVGLTIDGKYIEQRNEISLVWPYKDCILEGGKVEKKISVRRYFLMKYLHKMKLHSY